MLEPLNTLVDIEAGKKYEIFQDDLAECPIEVAGYEDVMCAVSGGAVYGENLKKELEYWKEDRSRLLDELEDRHREYLAAQGAWIKAYINGDTDEELEQWCAARREREHLQDILADLEEHDNNRPNLMIFTRPGHKYFAGCELFMDVDGMLDIDGIHIDDLERIGNHILNIMCLWLQGEVYRIEVFDWTGDTEIREWDNSGQPSDVEMWTGYDSGACIYDLNYFDLKSVQQSLAY